MDISGIWTVTIVYGSMYRKHSGKEMSFELTITQVGHTLTGTCIDILGTGVNEDPATIEGSVVNDEIKFRKQYPSLQYYDRGETKNNHSQKGKELNYVGKYDWTSQVFSGTWEYSLNRKFLGIFLIKNPSGQWRMSKKIVL